MVVCSPTTSSVPVSIPVFVDSTGAVVLITDDESSLAADVDSMMSI